MNPEKRTPGGNRANDRGHSSELQPDYSAPIALSTRRRWAPYATHVIERQRAGIEPNVFCFAGSDCWNQAEHRRRTHGDGSTLVLPPGEPPEGFRWTALDALCLIPGDAEGDTVRRLVVALLSAGCRCIVEIRPDQPPACHYADERDAREAA